MAADYALGWTCTKPGCIPLFLKTYPDDSMGPDRLIMPILQLSPDTEVVTFHLPASRDREAVERIMLNRGSS